MSFKETCGGKELNVVKIFSKLPKNATKVNE
jgi:hypothetical protein